MQPSFASAKNTAQKSTLLDISIAVIVPLRSPQV